METPHTVASLPKPLDALNGKVQAAQVYGIRAGRKRKRHEIAVGIDGEGVNVYNVQNQSLVTSYALPPQAYLCSPPCSIYVKAGRNAVAQRRTYLALRDGPNDRKRRFVCLVDENQTERDDEVAHIGPIKHEYRLADAEIAGINVVAASTDNADALLVLVTYEDGRVACMTEDLSATVWEHTEQDNLRVVYVAVTDSDTARKGLLTGRGDVLAALDNAVTGNAKAQPLLCRIVRLNDRRVLQLFRLRIQSRDRLQARPDSLQLLTSYDLTSTETGHLGNDTALFDLHAASGKLYQLSCGKFTLFDLTSIIPRAILKKGDGTDPVLSVARLGGATVLAVYKHQAITYETTYGSAVASVSLASSGHGASAGEKRKRTDEDSVQIAFQAVACYQDIGLVVGLRGVELIGIQLREVLRGTKRAKATLIDVLERGVGTTAVRAAGSAAKRVQRADQFEDWQSKVGVACEGNDNDMLESLVAKVLKLEGEVLKGTCDHGPIAHLDAVPDSKTAANGILLDPYPRNVSTAEIDRTRANYLLRTLFRSQVDNTGARTESVRLSTTASSPQIYRWLALAGLLTSAQLESSLAQDLETSRSDRTCQPGDIMAALKDFDDTFQLVHDVLALPVYWELPELVKAMALLIESFETSPDEEDATGLPTASAPANSHRALVNGELESQLEVQSGLAERELQLAVSTLSNGLQLRSETFRIIVDRLGAFPQKAITEAMRAMMRHEDLIFFVRVLRVEMLTGGWQNQYLGADGEGEPVDAPEVVGVVAARTGNEEGDVPSDSAMGRISVLMKCAVDAIGISGWLVGESADSFATTGMLQELKAEISACLEGLYDFESLGSLLEELYRYEYALDKAQATSKLPKRLLASADAPFDTLQTLPLGSTMDAGSGAAWTAEGKKSSRALTAERRAKVGRYVFERIRI
ncbi:hypothetical protein BAUCODRAFT_32278 [Baudoinia panamericana UAMH 10762]|uniref:Utp8 beta-propeller domain-containing protein n=1 Tax=Baudoinia panamericana (strain UAMH 10762) TaxID=717646 RepID=M2NGX5_BAUPA|nr:uncharacterized protein BAUCODRAFT_32278 [Baudoinia panamericana UAMH 10762]EMC98265.1 hypothetical protein BAUCODRAFT_32278 [Baudoinia panamericana UAMH 10762]